MNKRALTEAIKAEAHRLGFEKVGIARAEALEPEGARLRAWLSRGYHGSMSWMSRETARRIDPGKILPGARSVIVAAMNYYTHDSHSEDPEAGKISRYAWGDDYHEILPPRLEALLEFVKRHRPEARGKAYSDTGPVMEKAWAERAGIGWIGKHTNIITTDLGSWVFLGVLIVDVELDYDPSGADHCGSCTLCIEACPTGAIVEPYVLDANSCISYLTIEHRGEIPRSLGANFEGWIYGCDICQDVCPWNEKFSQASPHPEFAPRGENLGPRLESIAAMGQEEFSRRFRKSPVKRAKRDGLARNAAIILENKKERNGSPS